MSTDHPLNPGTLYVVATPIGNLGDFSPRASATLAAVAAICAEDTRTTAQLLAHAGLSKPLIALHEHNESKVTAQLLARLQAGDALALVSDAGTPLISDPGYSLVRAARDAGLPVVAVPGPCAVVAALSVAGLATDEFLFAGFLPAKRAARRERLHALAAETRTWVIYESPHRIQECADDLLAAVGPLRLLCVARELTKKFEESQRMPASELPAWLQAHEHRQRGEFALCIERAPEQQDSPPPVDVRKLMKLLLAELPASRAARIAAELTGVKRAQLYEMAVNMGGKDAEQT